MKYADFLIEYIDPCGRIGLTVIRQAYENRITDKALCKPVINLISKLNVNCQGQWKFLSIDRKGEFKQLCQEKPEVFNFGTRKYQEYRGVILYGK